MSASATRIYKLLSLAAIVLWFLYTLLCIFQPRNPLAPYNWYFITASLVAFGMFHGARRYGWANCVILFVIASVIATTSEHFSVTAGFPFGYYIHTPAMGPQIFQVPLIIGPVYFGLTYLVWALVLAIFGTGHVHRREFIFVAPAIAACIVTGFDMCFDPIGSTIGGYWHYRESGGYFGVPLSNYVGWFINAWAIFQCFALFLSSRSTASEPMPASYWYESSALWGLMGLQYPILLLATPGSTIVRDSGGWAWRSGDILQNAAIASVYTMILAALISALAVRLRTTGGAAGSSTS